MDLDTHFFLGGEGGHLIGSSEYCQIRVSSALAEP